MTDYFSRLILRGSTDHRPTRGSMPATEPELAPDPKINHRRHGTDDDPFGAEPDHLNADRTGLYPGATPTGAEPWGATGADTDHSRSSVGPDHRAPTGLKGPDRSIGQADRETLRPTANNRSPAEQRRDRRPGREADSGTMFAVGSDGRGPTDESGESTEAARRWNSAGDNASGAVDDPPRSLADIDRLFERASHLWARNTDNERKGDGAGEGSATDRSATAAATGAAIVPSPASGSVPRAAAQSNPGPNATDRRGRPTNHEGRLEVLEPSADPRLVAPTPPSHPGPRVSIGSVTIEIVGSSPDPTGHDRGQPVVPPRPRGRLGTNRPAPIGRW